LAFGNRTTRTTVLPIHRNNSNAPSSILKRTHQSHPSSSARQEHLRKGEESSLDEVIAYRSRSRDRRSAPMEGSNTGDPEGSHRVVSGCIATGIKGRHRRSGLHGGQQHGRCRGHHC
jgi:hypothetical protein